ncbi:DUF7484 family protein [Paraburkholderia madseniana]|uniref:DUF7484 family protein n=1 Tax=Paraburkholderia madseniana TaxID=2599607 RepID=UPI003FD74736
MWPQTWPLLRCKSGHTVRFVWAVGSQLSNLLPVGQRVQAAQAVMHAYGATPTTSTARAQLIGKNAVMMCDSMLLPPNIYLRCNVPNDENLAHL